MRGGLMPVAVLCFSRSAGPVLAPVGTCGRGRQRSAAVAGACRGRTPTGRVRACPPLSATQRAVDYHIGGRQWRIHLPAIRGPLRIAFTACNGFEAERTGSHQPARNELWRRLTVEHASAPFHLLLHGGDQLYADSLWQEVPAMAAWQRLPARQRLSAPFTPEMAEAITDYYFSRYCWLWEQSELAAILPAILSLMMWDDHDIFDGWGSHDPEWQACATFRGIYAAAREQFALFQLAT